VSVARYSVRYDCKAGLNEARQYFWSISLEPPPETFDDWCLTQRDTCIYKEKHNYWVTTLRKKHGKEKCEVLK